MNKIKWIIFISALFFARLTSANSSSNAPSGGDALLQALMGLLGVLVVIFALAWLAKRLNVGGAVNQKIFKPLATMPLGTREKAVLVEVGGQQILLGVAPGRVSKLHVFEKPVVNEPQSASVKATKPLFSTTPGQSNADFSTKLKEILLQNPKAE